MEKLEICLKDYSKFLKTKSGQDFLAELSKSEEYEVLYQVANCKEMSSKMLMELMANVTLIPQEKMKSERLYVILRSIASNPALDEHGLDALCDYCIEALPYWRKDDPYYRILTEALEGIASHKNTSAKTFEKLSRESEDVVIKLLRNCNLSDERLILIVENDDAGAVSAEAASELARRLKEKISPK